MVALFVRAVGYEEYGRYSAQLSLVVLVSALLVGWFNQAQLRYFSGESANRNDQRHLVHRVYWGVVVVVVLSAAILTAVDMQPLLWIGLVLLLVYPAYLQRLSGWQAALQSATYVKAESLRAVLCLAMPMAIAYALLPTAEGLLAGLVGAYIVALVSFRPAWRSTTEGQQGSVTLRACWDYGWPLSLWLATMSGFAALDRWMIAFHYDSAALGGYASVQEVVVRAYSLLLFPITLAVHPRIMAAANDGNDRGVSRLWLYSMAGQLLLLVPVGIAYVLGAERLMLFVLPDLSAESMALVWPLALSGFAWQFVLLAHKPLEVRGETRFMLAAIILSLLLHLALLTWLLPSMGVGIVPWASLTAALLYMCCCLVRIYVLRGVPRGDTEFAP